MTKLRAAARRLIAALRRNAADFHVYAGIALGAYAGGQAPEPFGAIAGPAIAGLGLIWIVRAGAKVR